MTRLVVVELIDYPGPRLMCGEDTAEWLERMGVVRILDRNGSDQPDRSVHRA
jgi:hypothetical protein